MLSATATDYNQQETKMLQQWKKLVFARDMSGTFYITPWQSKAA